MEVMRQSAAAGCSSATASSALRPLALRRLRHGRNVVVMSGRKYLGQWSALAERRGLIPENLGGSYASRKKRVEGIRLGKTLSIFIRKKFVFKKEPTLVLSGYNSLLWRKVAKNLHLVWQHLISGHGSQAQIGPEESLLGGGLASQILHFSLIFSLSMTSPWFEPDSALAGPETADIRGQLHTWKQYKTNSLEVFGSKGEFKAEFGSLPKKYSLVTVNYEGLRSITASTGHPIVKPELLFSLAEGTNVCQENYGFLPCSATVGGNLCLIVAYGYFLLLAAQLISNGSEILLEVMNPGLLGGLLLPILGALPDALLIFVSGVGGNVQEAQEKVMVGIGVLAGSIVILLTLGWAGSLYAGRCDLSGPGGSAQDRTLTVSLDWTGTGVTTDEQTRSGAWIMMVSTLPFLVVQIPLLDGHPAEGPETALTGCIIAVLGVFAYCVYQVSYPWLQKKRIGEARLQFLRSRALQGVTAFSGKHGTRNSILLQENLSGPSRERLNELFASFDMNKDGKIEKEELKGLLVGLELEEEGSIPDKTQINMWLQEFDVDLDGTLSQHEFFSGISNWAHRISKEKWSQKIQKLGTSLVGADDPNFWASQSSEAKKVLELLETEADTEENDGEQKVVGLQASTLKRKAALYLALGAAVAAVFADPLVDSIGGFSKASGIPPFFVAFVVTPFASNASELFSSFIFARGQRKRNISLTFSQLYGAVTMNNTLCLGLFLGVVYARHLHWDFSSEVTVILLSVVALGAIGGSRTTFPLWLALPVLGIYPLCISLVAVLDNLLGWH